MSEFNIRPLERDDREWVAHFLDKQWGTTQIVSRGKAVYGHLLPGFIAERIPEEGDDGGDEASESANNSEPEKVGLLTYNLEDNGMCEITTLNSMESSTGIGTALVDYLKVTMKEMKVKRLWLITTNDNLDALRFWQKRDFSLVAVHRDAIQQARRIKPQIPITGIDGIPIRDEIELEYMI